MTVSFAEKAIPVKKEKNHSLKRMVFFFGAGDGNRTHLSSLGSLHSTDELRPLMLLAQYSTKMPQTQAPFVPKGIFF